MTEKAKAQQFGQTMPLNLKDTKNQGSNKPSEVKMDPAEGVATIGLPLYQKETKRQFLQYVHDLEASISQYKTKLSELQRDHEILHESYMHELNNNGKSEHAVNVIKRIINKLVGKSRSNSNAASPGEIGEGEENDQQQEGLLCSLCCDLKEI